jgi:hypothetical protein
MILTKEFLEEEKDNCLDYICFYVNQLQFVAKTIHIGTESLKDPVFFQYSHEEVASMYEIIWDCAHQIELIRDAAVDREMQQYHEIKFLKEQVNKLAGEDVADSLLATFRKQEVTA